MSMANVASLLTGFLQSGSLTLKQNTIQGNDATSEKKTSRWTETLMLYQIITPQQLQITRLTKDKQI